MSGRVSNTIVTDGLVYYIDAANRKSYPGTGTNVNDLTINSNNGTLINGVGFDGKSWTFDGINDYVRLPNNFPNYLPTSNISVEVWFKIDVTGSNNGLISGAIGTNTNVSNRTGWTLKCNPSERALFIIHTVTNNYQYSVFSPTGSIDTSSYYQIVGVRDGIDMYIYINGIESKEAMSERIAGTTFNTITELPDTSNLLYNPSKNRGVSYGGEIWNTQISETLNNPTNGRISNVKIYNRALSADEVKQNYNAHKSRFGL